MSKSEFGKGRLFFSIQNSKRFRVYSAIPLSLSSVIQLDKLTYIEADEIIVDGEVRSEGQSIELVCRTLKFLPGSSINTSGKPSEIDFLPDLPKETPFILGSDGLNGENGGDGHSGGRVTISACTVEGKINIRTCGGKGGRAQDGGNGRAGQPGSPGAEQVYPEDHGRDESFARAKGGDGLPGGNAGIPGRRGKGGDGGDIHIVSINALETAVFDCGSGVCGDAAKGGQAGIGGLGGDGGRVLSEKCWADGVEVQVVVGQLIANAPFNPAILSDIESDEDPDRIGKTRCVRYVEGKGSPGKNGPFGDNKKDKVDEQNVEPAAKNGEIFQELVDFKLFSSRISEEFLDLLTCKIEDQYALIGNNFSGESYVQLRAQLEFLLEICVNSQTQNEFIKDAKARAYAMSRKIALGLDFFGYSITYAPFVSFDTYQDMVESLLPTLSSIENSYEKYWDKASTAIDKRHAIEQVMYASEASSHLLASNLALLVSGAHQMKDKFPSLTDRVDSARKILFLTEEALNNAIKNKHAGCDLIKVVTAVAVIAIAVYTGGSALAAAGKAGLQLIDDFAENSESLEKLWDAGEILKEDLTQVVDNLDSVSESIRKIGKAADELKPDERNVPRFVVEREKFDEVAKEFADFEEAGAYREAGYDYLKSVETRNQAIIDYNALLTRIIEAKVIAGSSIRKIEQLKSALNATADPAESLVMSTMYRIYFDSLRTVAAIVHAEYKSLGYLYGQYVSSGINQLNVSSIQAAHIDVVRQWKSTLEKYKVKRKFDASLDLQKLVDKTSWQYFLKTGRIGFTIRLHNPEYESLFSLLNGWRVTGISLSVTNHNVNSEVDSLNWTLQHGGQETLYWDRGRRGTVFNHIAKEFVVIVPLNDDATKLSADISEEGKFAGLSPFTNWMLNPSFDTSKIKFDLLTQAKLTLTGYFIDG